MSNKNLTYQKNNEIISSFMSISMKGYRMMSYINYKIQELEKQGELPKTIYLNVNEMAELLDIPNNGEKYKLADLATKELGKAVMYCYDRDSGDIKKLVLFPAIIFHNNDNSIEIDTQIFTMAMMRRSKNKYTICTLEDAKNFRSVYSARISDYLRMESFEKNMIAENNYEFEVDLTELELMAGTIVLDYEMNFAKIAEIMQNISNVAIENKYPTWSRFKEKILDKAIRDINKKTNMKVSYDTKRTGRGGRTDKVIFHVEKQPLKKQNFLQKDKCQMDGINNGDALETNNGDALETEECGSEPSKAELFEMCVKVNDMIPFPIDLDTCMILLKDASYDIDVVQNAVDLLERNKDTRNSVGFLRKAIKERWIKDTPYRSKKSKENSFSNSMVKRNYDQNEITELERILLHTQL